MAFRAFVGIPMPPEPALTRLLEALAATRADLKVVAAENLHMTLSFLGDVPDDAAQPLGDVVRGAVADLAPFRLHLSGVGAFPNAKRPRVVWMGARDGEPAAQVAQRVRDAVAQAGHPGDDKAFRAHVTLARTRSARSIGELVQFLHEHERDELPTVDVHEVRLYRSKLSPQGPAYETVAACPLEA